MRHIGVLAVRVARVSMSIMSIIARISTALQVEKRAPVEGPAKKRAIEAKLVA